MKRESNYIFDVLTPSPRNLTLEQKEKKRLSNQKSTRKRVKPLKGPVLKYTPDGVTHVALCYMKMVRSWVTWSELTEFSPIFEDTNAGKNQFGRNMRRCVEYGDVERQGSSMADFRFRITPQGIQYLYLMGQRRAENQPVDDDD